MDRREFLQGVVAMIGLQGGGFFYRQFNYSTSWYARIATPASHNWGNWTEVIAAVPFEIRWLAIYAESTSAAYTEVFGLQLGAGAAGSEAAIAPTMGGQGSYPGGFVFGLNGTISTGYLEPRLYQFPFHISPGTRVAARARNQITLAASTLDIRVIAFS